MCSDYSLRCLINCYGVRECALPEIVDSKMNEDKPTLSLIAYEVVN